MFGKLQSQPELCDVTSDDLNIGLEAMLVIDREAASRLGILPQTIDSTFYDAFGPRQFSAVFTQISPYHVVLEVDPRLQQNRGVLKNIYVSSTIGRQIPLSAFTSFQTGAAPVTINRDGQFPVVTLSFNFASGVSFGGAV